MTLLENNLRPVLTPFTTADLDPVMAIEKDCFSAPWPRESFTQDLTENKTTLALCAKSGTRLVGYLMGWRLQPEFHLGNLAVHRDYRRHGIATLLLGSVLDTLAVDGCAMASLEVRETNDAARRLYTNLGFIPVAIWPKYYADSGEDAQVMVKYF